MKVLVATDGSRGGEAALRFAARMAGNPVAALTVITVAAPRPSEAMDGTLSRARRLLAAAGRTLRRSGINADLRVVDVRRSESVPEAIRRESDHLRADLVVIGSEGRDTLQEWVVGGVALRLLYLASRPVAVVRPPKRRLSA